MPYAVTSRQGKLYRLGVKLGAPFHNLLAGGVCFQTRSERLHYNTELEEYEREPVRGIIMRLDEDDLQRIKTWIENHAILWGVEINEHGDDVRLGSVYPVSHDSIVTADPDLIEPVAKYLYIQTVSEEEMRRFEEHLPSADEEEEIAFFREIDAALADHAKLDEQKSMQSATVQKLTKKQTEKKKKGSSGI